MSLAEKIYKPILLFLTLLLLNNPIAIAAVPNGEIFYKAFNRLSSNNVKEEKQAKSGKLTASVKQNHYEEYYKSGNPKISISFQNNALHGKSISFHKNGKHKVEASFNYGQLSNEYINFRKNGSPSVIYSFSDGLLHGYTRFYSRNGKLTEEVQYKHGLRHGAHNKYYSNGNLKAQTLYNEGKRDGLMRRLNKGGFLTSSKLFANGRRIFRPRLGEKSFSQKLGEGLKTAEIITEGIVMLLAAAAESQRGAGVYQNNAQLSTQRTSLRGCCSWHNGVHSIVGNRVLCNDGMFSPKCRF